MKAQPRDELQAVHPRRRWPRASPRDIPEGWYVNLGIGIPTLVANYVPAEREVIFQSENGVIGMGPAPAAGQDRPWLINASKQHVTLRPAAPSSITPTASR